MGVLGLKGVIESTEFCAAVLGTMTRCTCVHPIGTKIPQTPNTETLDFVWPEFWPEIKKTMPIRLQPRTYSCPHCGWSKTVVPRSDVLTPGDVHVRCQSCGHAPLSDVPADAVSAALAAGLQALERLLRR